MMSPSVFRLIFTDLDGTLLDHETYDWHAAAAALERCREQKVPVVLVSSKTRAEMASLHQDLGLTSPYISENGGGVFFPPDVSPDPPRDAEPCEAGWKWVLGAPYSELVAALREIRRELGWDLHGFSDMDLREIGRLTGLRGDALAASVLREFDEPFVVRRPENPDPRQLTAAAATKGLWVTQGGRFHHLHGRSDKGMAVERVMGWYRDTGKALWSMALGDSPNDFAMLERVDLPVWIRSEREIPEWIRQRPGRIITRSEGPAGWNEAVLRILDS